jgi:hypothetical protein
MIHIVFLFREGRGGIELLHSSFSINRSPRWGSVQGDVEIEATLRPSLNGPTHMPPEQRVYPQERVFPLSNNLFVIGQFPFAIFQLSFPMENEK